jgi:hypothetical protein
MLTVHQPAYLMTARRPSAPAPQSAPATPGRQFPEGSLGALGHSPVWGTQARAIGHAGE